ncbi:DUF6502 family protein [Algiphilus sp.]|uniref:DUF6502 family protein n=1 Tax=Algiphilus sp. TaxID=1872431 RepID=UPI003B519DBC
MELKALVLDAMYQVLRPLARIAMRHGLTVSDVERVTRQAFVDSARAEYGIRGRPTNKSRVAALTGLSRAEVTRLLSATRQDQDAAAGQRHLLNRLITCWVTDARWLDADQAPRPLPLDEEQGDGFSALVRAIGSDVTWQTLLRELERLGLARKEAGNLHLLQRAFIPASADEADRLPYLGENIAAHIDTVDHNLRHGRARSRFERKLVFPGLDAEGLQKLQALLERDGQAWLESLNETLTPHAPEDSSSQRISGVGIYLFDMKRPNGGSES